MCVCVCARVRACFRGCAYAHLSLSVFELLQTTKEKSVLNPNHAYE